MSIQTLAGIKQAGYFGNLFGTTAAQAGKRVDNLSKALANEKSKTILQKAQELISKPGRLKDLHSQISIAREALTKAENDRYWSRLLTAGTGATLLPGLASLGTDKQIDNIEE